MLSALNAVVETMVGHVQEERLAAEEAAHIATEEAIRTAEAAKREEAGEAHNLSTWFELVTRQ